MPPDPPPKPQTQPQPHKFRDLARELGCDEDEAAFKDQVRRVAKAPAASKDETDRGAT